MQKNYTFPTGVSLTPFYFSLHNPKERLLTSVMLSSLLLLERFQGFFSKF
jgi:hypothetical protein